MAMSRMVRSTEFSMFERGESRVAHRAAGVQPAGGGYKKERDKNHNPPCSPVGRLSENNERIERDGCYKRMYVPARTVDSRLAENLAILC